MNVYYNTDKLPVFKNAVLTIGTFDGVHIGHQHVIKQLLQEAAEVDGTAVLITFFPHPKQVVAHSHKGERLASSAAPIQLLNTAEEKYELLHRQGINHIVVVPFDKAFASQSAASYIRDFLVSLFHPHTIIIGYDHRFGNNREGGYEQLETEGERYGFKVKEIPQHILKDITISSTRIREALLSGDIETAAGYLGYPYFFSGKVVKGNQLGRTIGYPTANLFIEDEKKLIPANAVYAVKVELNSNGISHNGMMNIGVRPTVDGSKRMIEVNIFNFDEMIYGSILKITLVKHLRSEVKFDGLDELKAQLAKDKMDALACFEDE